MPHQGYQMLQGGSSIPPLEAKTQYWIRRQTGTTDMLDGTDTNLYMTGFSCKHNFIILCLHSPHSKYNNIDVLHIDLKI